MPSLERTQAEDADAAESTAPLDDPITASAEIGPAQVRRVLERLATEPLRLRSDNLVPRPWGGRRLAALKRLEGIVGPQRIGESFEVSAFSADPESARYPSVVEFDDGSSMRLTELLARAGEVVLGPAFFAAHGPRFPLLPKFLDVAQLLSVQSHPRGNPELYVIVDCDPGASLRLGFAEDVDPLALTSKLEAARADQEALLGLLWVPEHKLAQVCADLFGQPGALGRLSERFAPLLRDPAALPRLRELLGRLDACYRETLALLNRIEVEPGMVLFNAHPSGAAQASTPSAEIHCLGNPERKALLVLEIRRPGVTFRAWDHVRFPLRELAVGRALDGINTRASRPEEFVIEPQPLAHRPGVGRLVECPAFIVDRLKPRPGLAVHAACEGLPTTIHAIAGVVRLWGPNERDWGQLRAGQSLMIPARVAGLRIEALTPDATLVQVTVPLPPAAPAEDVVDDPAEARRFNLGRMRRIVEDSQGPLEVLALVNPGDGPRVGERLRERAPVIFRADGTTRVVCHEELRRRGQLLGLLDALRADRAAHGPLDPERVALGIMLPGRGTRLSPLTQALDGIKPAFPVPIRAPLPTSEDPSEGVWLDAAAASLWSWTLVTWLLERQGFTGVAWKWGDEPQIAARELARFDHDLSDVDAIRFGAAARITEDLARNKEWLLVDPATGDLRVQLRRRERARLLERMGLADDPDPRAHVHIGSPAFSHRFLAHAEAVFGDLRADDEQDQIWLDVDGYLFEALTQDAEAWTEEVAGDPRLQALLERCPDFYARVAELRRRIEAERGHPLRIVVIDFGGEPYWADVGQLDKARAVWSDLRGLGEQGSFARELAGISGPPDAFGNYRVGAVEIPEDGSVRDSVIIDSNIGRGLVRGAVVVGSQLAVAGLEPGAVALECRLRALRMGRDSLAFRSRGEDLRVPEHHVHTSIAAEPGADRFESWFADARVDPGAPENYTQPRYGNPTSFAAKLEQLRRRG